MKRFILTAALCLTALLHSFAQEGEKKQFPVRFLYGVAFEFGGDEVAEVYFTNGETQSVKAGQGVSVVLGGQYQFPNIENVLLRATVGYKYVTTQADNAHIRLTRIPLHFTANLMVTEKIRLGGGVAIHRNIRFNADKIGQDIIFDGASGPIFEVAYRGVGLTYTAMQYKDNSNLSYSANAIGISFSGVFPKM